MNYPSNAIILRKATSFLTDKQGFFPVWSWADIPDMRIENKELWEKYDLWHEKYMEDKRFDWLKDIELRQLQKNYKQKWYKDRTREVKVNVVESSQSESQKNRGFQRVVVSKNSKKH